MKSRKPKASQPMTARIRATTFSGRCRLKSETAKVQKVSISSQSRIEPSWPPHTGREAIVHRQGAVRVLGDVEHRRNRCRYEGQREADEGEGDEAEDEAGAGPGQCHPVGAIACGTEHRQRAEHEGDAKGQPEGEVTELGNHAA